jgi:hypothetical protein
MPMTFHTAVTTLLVRMQFAHLLIHLTLLKRTPLRRTRTFRLLPYNLPRQIHQLLAQLRIIRLLTAWLHNRRRANILSGFLRLGSSIHGAHAAFKLGLLERLSGYAHSVAEERVRFMDVLGALTCIDDARVDGVREYVGVFGVQMAVEVL